MDPLDTYLGKKLKRYAAHHQPPADSRARLLKTAAFSGLKGNPSRSISSAAQAVDPSRERNQDSSCSLNFGFSMIYSMRMGFTGLRLIL